jgi:predicted TIM-barrel fold metal-dependent hydrolase
LRLIYSGLFDKLPRLQMIIGHLGEMLPFAAYRIDRYYGLGGEAGASRGLQRLPSEYLRSNFHVTTSGNFCPPSFACTLEVLGADRVMFSVDYPMDDATRRGVMTQETRLALAAAATSPTCSADVCELTR